MDIKNLLPAHLLAESFQHALPRGVAETALVRLYGRADEHVESQLGALADERASTRKTLDQILAF